MGVRLSLATMLLTISVSAGSLITGNDPHEANMPADPQFQAALYPHSSGPRTRALASTALIALAYSSS